MRCTRCGTELLPGKRFCHACGTRVEASCANCGGVLQPEFHFCPECGAAVDGAGDVGRGAVDDRFARMAQHIPDALARKIRATQGTIRGERKLVTVVFCDLVGSTAIAELLDPEEYRDLLEQYLELVFREIYRFEGIVNQLAGDGMMALFGAPIAHEDAPHRAIRAALAIRSVLEGFNEQRLATRNVELQARIGVHTGPVVVGTVGNDFKMDYTATGDTTNLASRLESLAPPGTILISESTYRLVRGFFEMRAVGPFTVKGKTDPVPAYEVLGQTAATTAIAAAAARGLTPLVGRDGELAQLRDCFDRLSDQTAQVVAVVGEAGSGKSRLIYEFKERLKDVSVVFFEARCSALTQLQPYEPIASMLRAYFHLPPGESASVARERLASKLAACDGDGASGEQCFAPLLRLMSLSSDASEDVAAEAFKRETYEAMVQVVARARGGGPAVIIIEDLHWIDDASRELIEMAIASINHAPIMLIISHRPDYMPLWRAQVRFTQINLRRLPQSDTTEIIRAIAGGPLPGELEDVIWQRTEGNPFFTEEIIRSLVDDGLLVEHDGVIELTRPLHEVGVPHTVQELLEARLDRLGSSTKRVAQVAAVLGRQFDRRQLARLLASESTDLDHQLAELERRGVIHRKNVVSTDEYRFGESLTQEVAYEGLLLRERRELHERAGHLLEELPADAVPERAALMASHFARSDNHVKAIESLMQAAREAERRPSWQVAESFYRQAWERAALQLSNGSDGDDRMKQLGVNAATSYARINRLYGSSAPSDFEAILNQARKLARSLGDQPNLVFLLTFLGMHLGSVRGRSEEGLALVEEGFSLAQRSGLTLAAVSMSRALSWAYLYEGRFDLAQRIANWVVDELTKLGQAEQRTDIYVSARWMLNAVLHHRGLLDAAESDARQSYQIAVDAGNQTLQIMGANNLAQLHFARGRYGDAQEWLDRAVAGAQAISHSTVFQITSAMGLAIAVEQGRSVALEEYLPLIEEGMQAGGNPVLLVRWVVDALCALGEVEAAHRVARQAYAQAAGRLKEMHATIALGVVNAHLGASHWPEAADWFAQGKTLAETLGVEPARIATLIGRATLALGRGDTGTAAKLADEALACSRAIGLGHDERKAERLIRLIAGRPTDGTAVITEQ
jgi:class 3 adenylate cyclase/tetratricopeptide (TPR) repeat protein